MPVGFNRDRGDLTGTEREGKRRRERGSGVERERKGEVIVERESGSGGSYCGRESG